MAATVHVPMPIYACAWLSDTLFLVGGGGGRSKTGVPNGIRVCEAFDYADLKGRPSDIFPSMDHRVIQFFSTGDEPVESICVLPKASQNVHVLYSTTSSVGCLVVSWKGDNCRLGQVSTSKIIHMSPEELDALFEMPKVLLRMVRNHDGSPSGNRIALWTNVRGAIGKDSQMYSILFQHVPALDAVEEHKSSLTMSMEPIDVDVLDKSACVTFRDGSIRVFDLRSGAETHSISVGRLFSTQHRLMGAKYILLPAAHGSAHSAAKAHSNSTPKNRLSVNASGKKGSHMKGAKGNGHDARKLERLVVVCGASERSQATDLVVMSEDFSRVIAKKRRVTNNPPSSFTVEASETAGVLIGTVEGQVADVSVPDLKCALLADRHASIVSGTQMRWCVDKTMVVSAALDASICVHRGPRLVHKPKPSSTPRAVILIAVVGMLVIFLAMLIEHFRTSTA